MNFISNYIDHIKKCLIFRKKYKVIFELTKIEILYVIQLLFNKKLFKISFLGNDIITIPGNILDSFFSLDYYIKLNEKRNKIIIDIGSNIGMSTLFFDTIYKNKTIYSFEPNPNSFKLLKYNTINKPDIKLFNFAVSDTKKKLKLFYSTKFDVSATTIGNGKYFKLVKSMKLSDFIKKFNRIDLLKIDAEGAEEKIIKDLKKNIQKIDFIIIEFHKNKCTLYKIIKILESNNFDYLIKNNYEKNKISKNVFFIYAKNKRIHDSWNDIVFF